MVEKTTQTELNLLPFHHSADSAILFPSSSCREEDESNFRSENYNDDANSDGQNEEAEDIVYRLNKKNVWQDTIKYVYQYNLLIILHVQVYRVQPDQRWKVNPLDRYS